MAGTALLIIGVVALFAAIVGGGIKIKEIEVGSVPSLWRQGLLGLFGVVVAVIGLVLMDTDNSSTNAAAQQNVAADANVTDNVGEDQNAVNESTTETNGADSGNNVETGVAEENASQPGT